MHALVSKCLALTATAAVLVGCGDSGAPQAPAAPAARDFISIVGSSTVYPFSTAVAEQFGRATEYKTPKIESTGSGGGLELFCQGIGVNHPDITNASRRIKSSEIENCASNGVTEIVEVKVGYDGIVLAQSREVEPLSISRSDIFLALAKRVPGPDGLVENTAETWSDINPELPNVAIEVYGPPPTSGTRDAFVELAMEGGCKTFESIAALKDADSNEFKRVCHTIREDGKYIEAGEQDNLIVQKLAANPDALGIFGYSFLDQNYDKVQGAIVDGVDPEFESIADGSYPVSRSLYMYVKKAHVGVIPGLEAFLAEFVADSTSGEEGYLAERGLIPLPPAERSAVAADVLGLKPMASL